MDLNIHILSIYDNYNVSMVHWIHIFILKVLPDFIECFVRTTIRWYDNLPAYGTHHVGKDKCL